MARKARVISIDLKAGTASFFRDLDQASGKIKQFGHGTVSDMQASSAAIRELMGGGNVRAVERFVGSVLGLAPVLKAAFPVVGALAFGGILVDLGDKAYKFFKEIQLGPETVRGAFRELNQSVQLTNDALATSNARLENEIAQLEGKHENTLALSLAEAKEAADRLADSLDKDLKSLDKLLKEQSGSAMTDFWHQVIGQAGTRDLGLQLGGETGFAGFRGKIAGLTDPKDLKAAYDEQIALLQNAMRQVQAYVAAPPERQAYGIADLAGNQIFDNMDKRLEMIRGELRALEQERQFIDAQTKNTADTIKRDKLQADHNNKMQDRPFEDAMKAMGAQIDAVKLKMEALGQSQAAQTLAKAFGESKEEIERINKLLERRNMSLTDGQKVQIQEEKLILDTVEANEQWRSKMIDASRVSDNRVKSLDMLTAALGRGYEATKQANIETRLMSEMGNNFNDPMFGDDQAQRRKEIGIEYDKEHVFQVGQAIDRISDQVEMEQALAEAQKRGAAAVRDAAQAVKERQLKSKDASDDQVAAERSLYEAQRANASSEAIAKLEEKIAATKRLTSAILGGAEAERQMAEGNKLIELQRGGASPEQISKQAQEDAAIHQQQVTTEAARTGIQYQNQLERIEAQETALKGIVETDKNRLAIELSLRNLENERLKTLADEQLALGTVGGGFHAFFLQMQEDAHATGRIIDEALNQVLDRSSANLAKLLTGQGKKGDWGKEFKDIGEQTLTSTIKTGLSKELGALGKHFGIDGLGGKPDGTKANPLWVRMAGAIGLGAGAAAGGGGGGSDSDSGSGGGIFSGVLGNMISHLFGPGHAGGGPVSPGTIYPVGEQGPEYFSPDQPGTIIPNGKLGGGGITINNHIDARGAELGAYSRIARGLEMTHDAAVAHAQNVAQEHGKRTPGK